MNVVRDFGGVSECYKKGGASAWKGNREAVEVSLTDGTFSNTVESREEVNESGCQSQPDVSFDGSQEG